MPTDLTSVSDLAILRKSRNIPADFEVSQSRLHKRWAATKADAVAELSRSFAEPTGAYVLLLPD